MNRRVNQSFSWCKKNPSRDQRGKPNDQSYSCEGLFAKKKSNNTIQILHVVHFCIRGFSHELHPQIPTNPSQFLWPPCLAVASKKVVDLSVGLRMEVARQLLEGTQPQEASAMRTEKGWITGICWRPNVIVHVYIYIYTYNVYYIYICNVYFIYIICMYMYNMYVYV